VAVTGLAAIDDCAPAVCPTYCGGPSCSTDSNYVAYPNYFACTGHDCQTITSVSRASGCNATVWMASPCIIGEWGGSIYECGPCDGQFSSAGACNDGSNLKIIACVTSGMFKRLCNCSNPYFYGLVRITMHLTGE
jgi:hypothetical protein